jgi:tripeptide aminopeptidase
MTDERRLLDRFARLCEIPSPTGSERAVADFVMAEMQEIGVIVTEDDAAGPARAGSGNLVARVPGERDEWLMLNAHLDTVPVSGPVEVVLEDGVFRSGGDTILGADDKAGVAVLVELAARHFEVMPSVGLELVFTVAEEDGLRGAKELDLESLRSTYGFVLDHAGPIGEIATASPTYKRLVAEFIGVEAHAGLHPEDGRSAIAAAAAAVNEMRLGRLDPETTANVGVVEGGTAANVVPGRCRIEAEARGIDADHAAAAVGAMVDACTWAAGERNCDVDVQVSEMFRGYRARPGSVSQAIAKRALAARGHEVREITTGGGSDANAFRAAGFDAVLLAVGTEAVHTPDERLPARRLVEVLDVCEEILAVAAER